MSTALRRFGFALSLAVSAPLALASEDGGSEDLRHQAADHFQKGLELYKSGDNPAALAEFLRANELVPNYNVLYNIGQAYFQLGDYVSALNALVGYLKEGGDRVPAARRSDVLEQIEKLKPRIGRLQIVTTAKDAEVEIDGVKAGRTPLPDAFVIAAGRHTVTVSKTIVMTTTRVVEVDGTGAVTKVTMGPLKPNSAPASSPRPASDVLERQRQLFDRANRSYDEGKFAEAEAAYFDAWSLKHSFDVAGNLGNLEADLKKFERAHELLEFAVREFPSGGRPSLLESLKRRLEEVRGQLAAPPRGDAGVPNP